MIDYFFYFNCYLFLFLFALLISVLKNPYFKKCFEHFTYKYDWVLELIWKKKNIPIMTLKS